MPMVFRAGADFRLCANSRVREQHGHSEIAAVKTIGILQQQQVRGQCGYIVLLNGELSGHLRASSVRITVIPIRSRREKYENVPIASRPSRRDPQSDS